MEEVIFAGEEDWEERICAGRGIWERQRLVLGDFQCVQNHK